MTVAQSYDVLVAEESDKLLDAERVTREGIAAAEQDGIVFIDEIDKITGREGRIGADVSREGVQRDLLPLIEGTTVTTKHGTVRSDHVLFVASGAFHLAKPSDLLPELQGRLPIRVQLDPLSREDLARILVEPEASLIKQYVALLTTEGVTLEFADGAVEEIAGLAYDINSRVENIGARRLQTVMEKLVEEISFNASDRAGETLAIDRSYVRDKVGSLFEGADLARRRGPSVGPPIRPTRLLREHSLMSRICSCQHLARAPGMNATGRLEVRQLTAGRTLLSPLIPALAGTRLFTPSTRPDLAPRVGGVERAELDRVPVVSSGSPLPRGGAGQSAASATAQCKVRDQAQIRDKVGSLFEGRT
jgi:hypothetical protein